MAEYLGTSGTVHHLLNTLRSAETQYKKDIALMSPELQEVMHHWRDQLEKRINFFLTLQEIGEFVHLTSTCTLTEFQYVPRAPTGEDMLQYKFLLKDTQKKIDKALKDSKKGNTFEFDKQIYQNHNNTGQVYLFTELDNKTKTVFTNKDAFAQAYCISRQCSPIITSGCLIYGNIQRKTKGFPLSLAANQLLLNLPKSTPEDMIGPRNHNSHNIARLTFPEADLQGLLGEGNDASKRRLLL